MRFYKHLRYCLILSISESSIVKISSIHLHSQTVRARELISLEKLLLQPATCHVPHVECHMSRVTCNVSFILFSLFSDKVVKLVGGGSVINGANPL